MQKGVGCGFLLGREVRGRDIEMGGGGLWGRVTMATMGKDGLLLITQGW
jgi:hypothetical protein